MEAGRRSFAYRYGFNGKELDNNIGGACYDYGMRIYDARIAKFLSVDPLSPKYPWYTPYQFAGNKPINCIDRDGLEEIEVHSASITGEIEALKLKGAGEDEIRGFIMEKMNIHSYSTPSGAELAGKHLGYAQNGKIVEVKNPNAPLTVWGYRPINSVNEEGKLYVSGYERYKVYGASEPIEEPKMTNPAKVVPKSSSNYSILDFVDNYMRTHGDDLDGGDGYNKRGGKQLLSGTIAVVTAPATIVAGGVGAIFGCVGLGNGLDDVFTNGNGESLTQQLATDENTKTTIGYVKKFATLSTGIAGTNQIATEGVKGFVNAANLVSTVNDAISTTDNAIGEMGKTQEK